MGMLCVCVSVCVCVRECVAEEGAMEREMVGGAGIAVCEVCCAAIWVHCSVCLIGVNCPLWLHRSVWRLYVCLGLPLW